MTQKHTLRMMGKKRGMMQLFDQQGFVNVCTVIEVEPNVITQIKTEEKDGYNAIQLGFDEVKTKDERTVEKRMAKPLLGHFKKNGIAPCRHLTESRLASIDQYAVGEKIDLSAFENVTFVDVCGISIGKGFQGAMKKYNFAGGRASHGNSRYHRGLGSTGMRSSPGRCFPGGKRASHMGSERKTVQNLGVVMINKEENLIIVRGQVPGPKGSLVVLNAAKKKQKKKK